MVVMSRNTCATENCKNFVVGGGLCARHYMRKRRTGTTSEKSYESTKMSGTIEYTSWKLMRQRVNNPNHCRYEHYGGRGITVCERWQKSFRNFYEDMGPRPTPKHSIDRIDVNGNYEPSNCRWADAFEQANNRRPRTKKTS